MQLSKETKKKLFKLVQMLIGIGGLKLLDYFFNGNTFIIIVKLFITIYIVYLAVTLLYGKSSEVEEEDE